jgi:hypothetical protein
MYYHLLWCFVIPRDQQTISRRRIDVIIHRRQKNQRDVIDDSIVISYISASSSVILLNTALLITDSHSATWMTKWLHCLCSLSIKIRCRFFRKFRALEILTLKLMTSLFSSSSDFGIVSLFLQYSTNLLNFGFLWTENVH